VLYDALVQVAEIFFVLGFTISARELVRKMEKLTPTSPFGPRSVADFLFSECNDRTLSLRQLKIAFNVLNTPEWTTYDGTRLSIKTLELAIYVTSSRPPKRKIHDLLYDLKYLTRDVRYEYHDIRILMLCLDPLSRLHLLRPEHEIILTNAWERLASMERFGSGDMTETREWMQILENIKDGLRGVNETVSDRDRRRRITEDTKAALRVYPELNQQD
jgi:hypothetical protein